MRNRAARRIVGTLGLVLLVGILSFTGCSIQLLVQYWPNGADGGTVPTSAAYAQAGATITVLGNTGGLTKTGYTWSGWNTSADGSGTTYTAGQSVVVNSPLDLYALWH